jgi:hypothetical protein
MRESKSELFFVDRSSVVRKIWGKGDIILFIFAGAAAEFALNKAVDWLYFTGKLPKDPLGRLFSTVGYARRIVFSSLDEAHKAIDTVRNIHAAVEGARGAAIPDWAYRDVLFMLIHYSIASYELFEHPLSISQKEDVYQVFYRVGVRMGLSGLPPGYAEWLPARAAHLEENLQKSAYTADLFKQYRRRLGALRFKILIEAQKLVAPGRVKQLLHFNDFSLLAPVIPVYKISRLIKMDRALKSLLLPPAYKDQILELDVRPA